MGEFTKTLASLDPNNPSERTHFNFKDGAFESEPNTKHMAFHFKQHGTLWHKQEREAVEKLKQEKQQREHATTENEDDEDQKDKADDDTNNNNETEDDKQETDIVQQPDSKEEEKEEILVKNQFNFSDRASQTFNEPLRDREVQTEPAPKSIFSQNANPSAIRDEYLCN